MSKILHYRTIVLHSLSCFLHTHTHTHTHTREVGQPFFQAGLSQLVALQGAVIGKILHLSQVEGSSICDLHPVLPSLLCWRCDGIYELVDLGTAMMGLFKIKASPGAMENFSNVFFPPDYHSRWDGVRVGSLCGFFVVVFFSRVSRVGSCFSSVFEQRSSKFLFRVTVVQMTQDKN